MDDAEKFYTDVDREALDVATFHKKNILQAHAENIFVHDDELWLKFMDHIPKMVAAHAEARSKYEYQLKREEENNMKHRQAAECPQCKKVRKVKIKSETRNELFGWRLDVVQCSVCRKTFTNMLPNNWDERIKFYENLYLKLFEVMEDGRTMAEIMKENSALDAGEGYDKFKELKESNNRLQKIIADLKADLDKKNISIESARDFLLLTKLRGRNLEIPIGSS